MDSGNSGSIQSSSGGSEEYDSRADSISAFFNHPFGSQLPPPLPPQHQTHPSSAAMFDPLSNYFDHPLSRSSQQLTTNPNSVLNLDVLWSKNLRSEPNCTDLGGFMASASSSPTTQQLLNNQHQAQSRTTFPCMQISQGAESATKSTVSGTSDQPNNSSSNNNRARNPKKRSRASRRAPTTVLTTDTSNFRAMVQEFTGIPAPPFTSSPFPRPRLDLFSTPSTMRSTTFDPSSSHYLLRPFPQKIQPPPLFVSSSATAASSSFSNLRSSLVDGIASTRTTNITTSTSTSINHQLPLELGFLKQPQNLLNINMNMQNPILNFQSPLQAPQKYPLPNSTSVGTKPLGSLDIPSIDSPLKMGVFEDFGLSHGHANTNLQEIVSSDGGALPRNENGTNHPSWGEVTGSQQHDQSLLRSANGSYRNNSQRASSSDFHGGKGPENVAPRSEGMMEPWICSSD